MNPLSAIVSVPPARVKFTGEVGKLRTTMALGDPATENAAGVRVPVETSEPDEAVDESAFTVMVPPVFAAIWPNCRVPVAVTVNELRISALAVPVAVVAAWADPANEAAAMAPTIARRSDLRIVIWSLTELMPEARVCATRMAGKKISHSQWDR